VKLHLETISTDEPRHALDDANDSRATKRLIVAIACKQGVSQTNLAEWHGLSCKTVYNCLQRFEEDSVRYATSDKTRPGCPPKLDREEQSEFSQLLHDSPANAG
jgi:transposase